MQHPTHPQTALFKALANSDRLRIMDMLAAYPVPQSRTVQEIADALDLSQSWTSQHLITLRRAGLVVSQRDGTTVYNVLSDRVQWPVSVLR
jgi:DNA-binding transcriptional ArsR family regulator